MKNAIIYHLSIGLFTGRRARLDTCEKECNDVSFITELEMEIAPPSS